MKFYAWLVTFVTVHRSFYAEVLPRRNCGQQTILNAKTLGRETPQIVEWPWMVSVVYWPDEMFLCSGSLISKKHVLSAAQCFENKNKQERSTPEYLKALVGKSDLNVTRESGSETHSISALMYHPDWDAEKSYPDIALVTLSELVNYGRRIKPVCLPITSFDEVIGSGTVIGWAGSENSDATTLRKMIVTAVNRSLCSPIYKHQKVSQNAICVEAETQENSSCLTDGTSGFYQRYLTSWNIRGILLPPSSEQTCKTNKFFLFTNVAQYDVWITEIVEERKESDANEISLECVKHHGDTLTIFCSVRAENLSRNYEVRPIFMDQSLIKNSIDVRHIWINVEKSNHLPNGLGQNFPNLDSIEITGLAVKFIESSNFRNSRHVKSLKIYETSLKFIGENVFRDLKSLEILKLTDNTIEKLSAETFAGLTKMEELELRRNKLTQVPAKLFQNLKQIKKLQLSENPIKLFAEESFKNLKILKQLHLNSLEVVKFPTNLFANMTKLEELFIDHCKLPTLERNLFKDLKSLKRLHAGGNPLKTIAEDVFSDLVKLEDLQIYQCGLKSLPGNMFANLTNLRRLDASFNELIQLDKNLFRNNLKIESIALEWNKLKRIEVEFSSLTNLNDLNLVFNECINKRSSEEFISFADEYYMTLQELITAISEKCAKR